MAKRRLEDLDLVKAIAILLVVFCHLVSIPDESIAGNLLMLLAWGAVPCFMMCSGYVLLVRSEPLGVSLTRVARTYAAMVVWKLIYLAFYALLGEVQYTCTELFQYLFLCSSLQGVGTEHFWFLYAYMAMLLFTPVLQVLFAQPHKGVVWLIFVLSFLGNQGINTGNLLINLAAPRLGFEVFDLDNLRFLFPFGGEYSSMLPYFILGGLLCVRENSQNKQPLRNWMNALLLLSGLCGLTAVKYLQTHSLAWMGKYLISGYGWSSTFALALGLFGLIRSMSSWQWSHRLGKTVGQNTMGIFYWHYLLAQLVVWYIYPSLPEALWVNVAKTLLVTFAATLLTIACKKFAFLRRLV